ncbi:ABC transporter substrate-binding protein [Pandoraea commovens]|uniref:Thiamine pyrimidine synthase n=1 Tax=Pandoraea commovens TaxID=2508289 RepID=A0ABY5Q999_9BURK|nr:ABC transporter substrate-binding protein [Pandoraea commovens]UVA77342.1 ABC transporter substrate-binding protein [Pandoraea commovens]
MQQWQWTRRWWTALACVGTLGMAGIVGAGALWATPVAAQDKVKFNLSWLPQGSTGGVLVAINKGYYREAGLEVSAIVGHGGQRTVNEVDQGLFEFGYGDPISVMLNRAQGGKTRMVGSINAVWPGAICYLAKPGRTITKPADLKGMSMGGGGASPLQNIVPAWLKANGLPPTSVKLLRLDPSTINPSFLQGRVDLTECWEGANLPVLKSLASKQGREIGSLRYRDFGLDMVGNGIVTTETMIAQKPDVVRRFVQATYRGYAWMREHPEASAGVIVSQYPMLDKQVMVEQIRQIGALETDSETKGHKPGWLPVPRMESTAKFVRDAFNLAPTLKATDIYTNQFVE